MTNAAGMAWPWWMSVRWSRGPRAEEQTTGIWNVRPSPSDLKSEGRAISARNACIGRKARQNRQAREHHEVGKRRRQEQQRAEHTLRRGGAREPRDRNRHSCQDVRAASAPPRSPRSSGTHERIGRLQVDERSPGQYCWGPQDELDDARDEREGDGNPIARMRAVRTGIAGRVEPRATRPAGLREARRRRRGRVRRAWIRAGVRVAGTACRPARRGGGRRAAALPDRRQRVLARSSGGTPDCGRRSANSGLRGEMIRAMQDDDEFRMPIGRTW
jgi:hypothetical protein